MISQREANAAQSTSMFNSIERKDVGITLRLTPHITEGDVVRLEVYQEMSAVLDESSAQVLISVGPTLTKRSAKTSISLKNGQTVVIGGLMQERKEKGIRRVPFLSAIPLLGELFKYRTNSLQKTNLLIFLTPHIISDDKDADEITAHKKQDFAKETERFSEREIKVKFKDWTQPRIVTHSATDLLFKTKLPLCKHSSAASLAVLYPKIFRG